MEQGRVPNFQNSHNQEEAMKKNRTKDEGRTRQKVTRNQKTLKDLSPTAKQGTGVKGGGRRFVRMAGDAAAP